MKTPLTTELRKRPMRFGDYKGVLAEMERMKEWGIGVVE